MQYVMFWANNDLFCRADEEEADEEKTKKRKKSLATFFQSESKANLPKSARFFSERKLCNTMALWWKCDWILATNVIIVHRKANSQVCLEGQCIVICCLEYLWHCAFSMDAPSEAFVITDIGGYRGIF